MRYAAAFAIGIILVIGVMLYAQEERRRRLIIIGTPQVGDWYVRTDGASSPTCNGQYDADSNATPNCAFDTIQEAADASSCAETILVRAGNYNDCSAAGSHDALLTINGVHCTAGNRLIIKGFGGTVQLDAEDKGGGDYCDHSIYLNNSDYITIGGTGTNEGFTITGSFDQNVENTPGSTALGNFRGGNESGDLRYIAVIGNTWTGTTLTSLDSYEAAEFQMMHAPSGEAFEGHEFAYNNITLKRLQRPLSYGSSTQCCSDACGTPNPNPTTIHHNTIEFDGTRSSYRHFIYLRGLNATQLYNNYIKMGDPSSLNNGGYVIYDRENRGMKVWNNIFEFYGTGGGAYAYYTCECSCSYTMDSRVYNNTFYGRGANVFRLHLAEGSEVRNNLMIGDATGFTTGYIGNTDLDTNAFGYTGFHNVTNPWDSASCTAEFGAANCDADSTNVYADPGIVGSGDKPTPYFELDTGSIVENDGSTDSDAPSDDYLGNARTGNPDLGADELGSGYAMKLEMMKRLAHCSKVPLKERRECLMGTS
jgi:hypothetical protein